MNKVLIGFLSAALLSVSLLSCGKDSPEGGGGGGAGPSGNFSLNLSLPGYQWTGDERVIVYSQDGSASAPSSVLSAQGSGAQAAFGGASVKQGKEYWLLFPQSSAIIASSTAVYAAVPAVQSPVEGGVDPAALLAAGATGSRSGNLTLQPLTSTLKFTLAGEGAASLRKVTVQANKYIAGDAKISGFGGSLSIESDNTRNRKGQSGSITLEGSFRPGVTYGISLLPGADSFELVFEDAEGRKQRVTKSGTTQLGKALDLGTLTLEAFSGDAEFLAHFTSSKSGIKPYVLVILGDGFTEAEREKFVAAASATADFIFDVQPLKHFKEYFSVYIGWKAAGKSGVGQTWGTTVSNGTMASYKQAGRDKIYSWIAERCPEIKDGKTPQANAGVIMLVNNDEYIRPVCDWEPSGRFVAPVGLKANRSGSTSIWCYGATWANYEWRDGARYTLTDAELKELGYSKIGGYWSVEGDYRHEAFHEAMGHGFTRLMDEYWYGDKVFPNCTYSNVSSYYHGLDIPTGLNISVSSTQTPWDLLLGQKQSLAAADSRYERIGIYEGGLAEVLQGVWRPEQVSVMMDNRPYYSTWQRALTWQRLMRASGEKPTCDVTQNEADLKAYLEIDKQIGGSKDPLRDK